MMTSFALSFNSDYGNEILNEISHRRTGESVVDQTWHSTLNAREHIHCDLNEELSFHGHGGSMRNAVRSFGYHALWPEAIVVSRDSTRRVA